MNSTLEQKVAERTEELHIINKELESFTYSVSHDLRAPLRGIVGFTAMLEENYTSQLDEEAKRIMAIIRRNTLKMGRLIDDLLAFSRMGKQELVKTKIDTDVLVHEIVEDLLQQQKDPDRIQWEIHRVWYGYRWFLRPWKARLSGRRPPSRFWILTGKFV